MGIHISEESEAKHTTKEVWEATSSTFLTKLVFALSFAVPVLLLPLQTAVLVGIFWGMGLLTLFSYYLAKREGKKPLPTIGEHLIITVAVIFVTYYVGKWVAGL